VSATGDTAGTGTSVDDRARGPSPARRLAWTMRIGLAGLRRDARSVAVCASAFAVITVALAVGFASSRAPAEAADATVPEAGAQVVAFLRDDLPETSRDGLMAALRALPDVSSLRLLDAAEALARLRVELGDRAQILDGVEDGFLPATLEISLVPGPDIRRADAIAWRLRRMDGVTDVDVLRTAADQRLARARRDEQRAVVFARIACGVATLLSLTLAAASLRRRRADARVLVGLGFTGAAIAAPGLLAGTLAAVVGVGGGLGVLRAGPRLLATLPLATPRWPLALASAALLVLLGAALGWWGRRPGPDTWNDDARAA